MGTQSDRRVHAPSTVRLERLDSVGLPHARAALYDAIDTADGDVHVDLDDVEWLDRWGLGLLAAAHERAHQRGHHLMVHTTNPRLRRTLAVSRLARVLHLTSA